MITVTSRKELAHQRAKFVLVEREMLVYQRVDDEYIKKPYFSVAEVVDILELQTKKGDKNRSEVHRMCKTLGIQARANRRKKLRITLQQLRQMANMV